MYKIKSAIKKETRLSPITLDNGLKNLVWLFSLNHRPVRLLSHPFRSRIFMPAKA